MSDEEPKQVIVERERKSSTGTVIAVIVGLLLLIFIAMYGVPYLSGGNNSTVEVNTPAPSAGSGTSGQ